MTVAEKIIQHVQFLSEDAQEEVLDFVEYIESKKMTVKEDPVGWGEFSLAQAMRGMEDEEALYFADDLKESFA